MTDLDKIGRTLKIYADVMRSYIFDKLRAHYGEEKALIRAYLDSFRSRHRQENVGRTLHGVEKPEDIFDIAHIKDLFLGNRHVFGDDFSRTFYWVFTWADEIIAVCNQWAHQSNTPADDIIRSLGSIVRILNAVGAEDEANAIKDRRDASPFKPPSEETSSEIEALPNCRRKQPRRCARAPTQKASVNR